MEMMMWRVPWATSYYCTRERVRQSPAPQRSSDEVLRMSSAQVYLHHPRVMVDVGFRGAVERCRDHRLRDLLDGDRFESPSTKPRQQRGGTVSATRPQRRVAAP